MNPIDALASDVAAKLRRLGFRSPTLPVVHALLELAYRASLKTEEGRFLRGSLTFANPKRPEFDPPLCRRADYPRFFSLGERIPLTVPRLVKLARAIDSWSGSIAVYGKSPDKIAAWGIVDQLVQQNIGLNREPGSGMFANPGVLTIVMDGVGDLSVYHGTIFLGALREHVVVRREYDVLRTAALVMRLLPHFEPYARAIARATRDDASELLNELVMSWGNVIARLCIGLRRARTGGTLLITPKPLSTLHVGFPLRYDRLSHALILKVLDECYFRNCDETHDEASKRQSMTSDVSLERILAETDKQDRVSELTGAVKLVTSLACVDGVVLLDPTLRVSGFGAKIGGGASVGAVYAGYEPKRSRGSVRRVDLSLFGTRHSSVLRYCRADPHAIGIVVSQDGLNRPGLSGERVM